MEPAVKFSMSNLPVACSSRVSSRPAGEQLALKKAIWSALGFIDQYSGTLYLMCLEPVDTGQKSEATVPPFSVTACQMVSALIESAYQ